MCVYIYIYICICIHIYISLSLFLSLSIYIYTHIASYCARLYCGFVLQTLLGMGINVTDEPLRSMGWANRKTHIIHLSRETGRGLSSGIIRQNWSDTEQNSMAPAQG